MSSSATPARRPVGRPPDLSLPQRRREEIVRGALRVFAERGYSGAGIADIARELAMGHGTIYRYFENKRAIVEAVIEFVTERLALVVSEDQPNASHTMAEYREQVGRIGRRLYDLFIEEPDIARVLFGVAVAVDDEITERVNAAYDLFGAGTELYLKNGIERGFLDAKLDTETIARAINGIIWEGARRLIWSAEPEAERDRWIAAAQRLMFDGTGRAG
jgi:AcrR family transcriptional regulator